MIDYLGCAERDVRRLRGKLDWAIWAILALEARPTTIFTYIKHPVTRYSLGEKVRGRSASRSVDGCFVVLFSGGLVGRKFDAQLLALHVLADGFCALPVRNWQLGDLTRDPRIGLARVLLL